jgi:Flp pilus assembly protein TadG
MTKPTDKKIKNEKGQSLIEVALSLTFLLIMLAGAVDLGRIFIAYISMRDAAQEGVAFGSVYPTYCNQIIQRVVYSSNNNFMPDASMVTVIIGGADCASASQDQACIGQEIVVTISNPAYPLTMPFIGSALGNQTIPLEVTTRDTILRPPCP